MGSKRQKGPIGVIVDDSGAPTDRETRAAKRYGNPDAPEVRPDGHKYRFGDQRPDGMYFYARRTGRLTSIWLTKEAFKKRNKGKMPVNRQGRLRADGRMWFKGDWVTKETYERVVKLGKFKRVPYGSRSADGKNVCAGHRNGGADPVWIPVAEWDRRKEETARVEARKEIKRRPLTRGEAVRPGLTYVTRISGVPVFFNCAQYKAALEGRDCPPELTRIRRRAFFWLRDRIRRSK